MRAYNFTKKENHLRCFLWNSWNFTESDFYRRQLGDYFQFTALFRTYSGSLKTSLDKLLALSATNQLNHSWMSVWDLHKDLFATNSQCLSPKYLNNQGRRKHFFVADFDGTNEKRYLTEAVTQRYFTKAEFWNIW